MTCTMNSSEVENRLAQLKASYKINAVVLQQRYISAENLIEEVMNLNLHNNSNRQAQFALAVHVTPYAENILSVAVAVASLNPH